MKKASLILSQLGNLPQFKVLKQQVCYKRFISLLGEKWQKAIAFVYIKNHTLFIAVKHPGFKMELNYNRDLLKSVLTQLASHDKACSDLVVDKVAVFHGKYYPVSKDKETSDTMPYYHEIATADFAILAKDKAIRQRFEALKETIGRNRRQERR